MGPIWKRTPNANHAATAHRAKRAELSDLLKREESYNPERKRGSEMKGFDEYRREAESESIPIIREAKMPAGFVREAPPEGLNRREEAPPSKLFKREAAGMEREAKSEIPIIREAALPAGFKRGEPSNLPLLPARIGKHVKCSFYFKK